MTSIANSSPKVRAMILVDAVRYWPKAERRAWRALLDTHPEEALFVAELALEFDGIAFADVEEDGDADDDRAA
jgi:hypothetical protein